MRQEETYRAIADAGVAAAKKAKSPFTITVRFLGGLSDRQKAAFKKAAHRWSRVIVGDLPRVKIDGEIVDDVLITAEGAPIDGVGRILGQAGPSLLRPATAKKAAFLPAKGEMQFDTADLEQMEAEGTIDDVITHEMGHVLGIGTVWRHKELLRGAGTHNPVFTGAGAVREYTALRGSAHPLAVPVENTGGAGTADSHWRETVFRNELMSGFIAGPSNPISRVTVASLEDLGYVVNMDAAEAFQLHDLLVAAERGLLTPPQSRGMVLPRIPSILPDDSLQP
jgi:leishmanolysin